MKDPETMKRYPNEVPPQVLVGSTSVLGTGYNLTRGLRLIQMTTHWVEKASGMLAITEGSLRDITERDTASPKVQSEPGRQC